MTSNMPTIYIELPEPLQELAGGTTEVPANGATVGAALDELATRHKTLVQRVLTRGGLLRPHVNLFLNDYDIRTANGLDTPVGNGDTLMVVPSVAGG